MWKAMHNIVPRKDALRIHHVSVPVDCPRCGEIETIEHLLFFCSFAFSVWALVPTFPKINFVPNVDIGDIFQGLRLCRNLPPCGLREPMYPWICWELWKARNSLVFNAIGGHPEEVYLRAIRRAKEWSEALMGTRSVTTRVTPRGMDGRVPRYVVCNSDVAMDSNRCIVGLGWVFMAPSLEVIAQSSASRHGIISVLVGEGLALLGAVQDALRLGLLEVEFFSDSMSLISLLRGHGVNLELQGIIFDIRKLCIQFLAISFHYVPRSQNVIADGLAKAGLYLAG